MFFVRSAGKKNEGKERDKNRIVDVRGKIVDPLNKMEGKKWQCGKSVLKNDFFFLVSFGNITTFNIL